ncbi:MAG: ATP phosphoribosyltransferase regulatory subunit [Phycisphaera sp.]|nr:MAG: ATP phosphoribosyltransferase regulatory subunit [Phycisphaera sp.]
MARQQYITRLWRDTAIRHGFEEINGPTFEMLDLYTRKSGEGIVSELFRFRREGGEDNYAMRPEFTPTLARMYAARAASLPSPTKWFSIGPYFRAEKPQRGRLREFLQWNVDVLGGEPQTDEFWANDAETISVMTMCLGHMGLRSPVLDVHVSHRYALEQSLRMSGVSSEAMNVAIQLVDSLPKLSVEAADAMAGAIGLDLSRLEWILGQLGEHADSSQRQDLELLDKVYEAGDAGHIAVDVMEFCERLNDRGSVIRHYTDMSIARGLAYYTGTVFEVIAEGERAIAGGGRYDNLIELFGGPPTPAVGFGMGDVVLGLLLDDKGLMPGGAELLDALSRPGASLRPEAFVVAGSEDEDALVEPLLANLRRGVEREGFEGKPWAADRYAARPMHARRTYKTTRNLKKLLTDAEKQHARFAVVLHGADKVQVKDLDKREELVHDRGDFSVDPASNAYVGTAIASRLGF